MFKKPFNRKVGETRQCKLCDTTFHTMKPSWTCRKCGNAKQKIIEEAKRKLYNKKDKYPFDTTTNVAGRRFCSIRTALSKAWKEGPEAVKRHYDKQLKEAEEFGIIEWINDRRNHEAMSEKVVRSRKQIVREIPDTRGYYEE